MAVLRLGSAGLGLSVLEVLDLGTAMKLTFPAVSEVIVAVQSRSCRDCGFFATIISTTVIAIILITINSAGSCRGDRLLRVPSSLVIGAASSCL